MNTRTLPLQAIALHDDGTPWYPFSPGDGAEVLYAEKPVLPTSSSCWAKAPEDDPHPRFPIDQVRLTQLLYLVPNLTVVTDDEAPEVVDQYLRECRCNVDLLANWTDDRYDSPFNAARAAHKRQARELADRWLSTGADLA